VSEISNVSAPAYEGKRQSANPAVVALTLAGAILTAVTKAAKRIAARMGWRRKKTLSERLGYGSDARFLIVHADDLGIARSVNSAFIDGLAAGLINSGSVMVPCPWFSEIAALSRSHPGADIGLHLTLTSEKVKKRWASVASPTQVPSLVDQDGCLLERWTPENSNCALEIEIELRAQIERAYASGLLPTHLDSHQFRLQHSGAHLFAVYLKLAREYHLPILVSREWFSRFPYLRTSINRHDIVLDRIIMIRGDVTPENWAQFYRRALESLPPGVTQVLVHPGHDDEELRDFFGGVSAWGAAWRERDLNFFTSDEFRTLLAEQNIQLVTWREIADRLASRRRFLIWTWHRQMGQR